MNNNQKKLFDGVIIVSDLDGTYIDDNSKQVLSNTRKIEYFKQNGGSFTFATGRALSALTIAIPDLKEICNFPAILCNGSYIYDIEKDEKISEIFLNKQKAYKLIKTIIEKFPDIGCRITIDDYQVCPTTCSLLEAEKEKYKSLVYKHSTLDEIYNLNWSKCVFVGQNEQLQKLQRFAMEKDDPDFTFCFSSSYLYEILAKGATKGDRLKDLKKCSNSQNPIIFAIGDQENDIAMLEKADFAACPSNAIECVKQIPGIIKVCSNNQGAICGLIEDIENNINIYNQVIEKQSTLA